MPEVTIIQLCLQSNSLSNFIELNKIQTTEYYCRLMKSHKPHLLQRVWLVRIGHKLVQKSHSDVDDN